MRVLAPLSPSSSSLRKNQPIKPTVGFAGAKAAEAPKTTWTSRVMAPLMLASAAIASAPAPVQAQDTPLKYLQIDPQKGDLFERLYGEPDIPNDEFRGLLRESYTDFRKSEDGRFFTRSVEGGKLNAENWHALTGANPTKRQQAMLRNSKMHPAQINGRDVKSLRWNDIKVDGVPIRKFLREMKIQGPSDEAELYGRETLMAVSELNRLMKQLNNPLKVLEAGGKPLHELQKDPMELVFALMTGMLSVGDIKAEDLPESVQVNGIPLKQLLNNITVAGTPLSETSIIAHGESVLQMPPMGNMNIASGYPGETNGEMSYGSGPAPLHMEDGLRLNYMPNTDRITGTLEIPWNRGDLTNRFTTALSMDMRLDSTELSHKGELTLQLHPFNFDVLHPIDEKADKVRDQRLVLSLAAPGLAINRPMQRGEFGFMLDKSGYGFYNGEYWDRQTVPFLDIASVTWTNDRTGKKAENGELHFRIKGALSTDLRGPDAGRISPNVMAEACVAKYLCLTGDLAHRDGMPRAQVFLGFRMDF